MKLMVKPEFEWIGLRETLQEKPYAFYGKIMENNR